MSSEPTTYGLLDDELNGIDHADDIEEFASDRDYGEESDFDFNDYSSDTLDSEPEAEHEPPLALVKTSSIHSLLDHGAVGTGSS
ncbi:hypothetical protein BCR41DRAFT_33335 [Lobosporangium transversale]|uniref:Uncharacterized protein n=1 Tax=Lobosporangium transversale TaxID=64571 RepID=A0A1Y2GSN7_9FUNG|nr:hypothetical protein BCR41DRAFT_33335 [Lobosporangium transversale]ORZ19998.1 hypothetical protein BCR41DRAFT_33335 [Lobosporangium transversale]|eukprot:XP_021882538.1 hypothetical protein BCR41DRAFT_33335 [Lobosporangium transversale]